MDEQPFLLDQYINLSFDTAGTKVAGKQAFEDDEFSDNEIALMQSVAERFKYTPASELVDLTHRESSPWYKSAKANGLLELFASKRANTSNFRLDLGELVKGDAVKEQLFRDYQEYYNTVKSLKG